MKLIWQFLNNVKLATRLLKQIQLPCILQCTLQANRIPLALDSVDRSGYRIVDYALDAVKKLLATTNRPIHTISEACGYTDLACLKKLFKQRFGITMREWRKRS